MKNNKNNEMIKTDIEDFHFNICGKLSVIRCYILWLRTGSNPADINLF